MLSSSAEPDRAPSARATRSRLRHEQGSRTSSDAIELGDGLLQRFELANERIHAALAIIDGLRLFEHPGGVFLRHHDDAILVGDNDVAWTNRDARALDGDVLGDGGVMPDCST